MQWYWILSIVIMIVIIVVVVTIITIVDVVVAVVRSPCSMRVMAYVIQHMAYGIWHRLRKMQSGERT